MLEPTDKTISLRYVVLLCGCLLCITVFTALVLSILLYSIFIILDSDLLLAVPSGKPVLPNYFAHV